MFRVELHKHITRISSVYYRVGLWHREDEATVGQIRLKFFYSLYYYLYVVSLSLGASGSADIDEIIFSVAFTLIGAVVLVKLLYITWRKKEIFYLLNRICVYSVDDDESFAQINKKLNNFWRFVIVFYSLTYVGIFCMAVVIPLLGSERKLYFNIAFPFDWENNEFAYWMAFTFLCSEVFFASIAVLLSTIVWYLMLNCGLRFEVLGQKIRDMGKVKSVERIGIHNGRKISNSERQNLYLRDLLECTASHNHLKEQTKELHSFLSELFVVQLATSALSICGSIYCLVFSSDDSSVEHLVYAMTVAYNVFEIFMIMNFGNEIKFASDRLSYCLFESDWIDRAQSTKKIVLIFGEFLMKPHKLMVLKLYPLSLETFTRVLNSAYSSFNILQNFK